MEEAWSNCRLRRHMLSTLLPESLPSKVVHVLQVFHFDSPGESQCCRFSAKVKRFHFA